MTSPDWFAMRRELGSSPRNPDPDLLRLAQDFTDLLTAVSTAADLLSELVPPGHAARAHLEELRKAAGEASTLTLRLRVSSGPVSAASPPVVLEDVVAGAAEMLAVLVGTEFRIERALSGDRSTVRIDAGTLEQIIVHLGVHACLGMPDRGTITLETSKATRPDSGDAFATFSMSDTGTGLEAAARARSLARGARAIGLGTVHRMIGEVGGFVQVASDPVRGGTVTIYLPLLSTRDATSLPAPRCRT